ncbi:MAG: tetratricopeptide repeat protein, partial [Candidatus Omnitrophica bacterium]|nr:tetratricopeptide repeat protein [Candidatus Omnitrophota bacterium]
TALCVLHEKIHNFIHDLSGLGPPMDSASSNQQFEEIITAAIEFLCARKAGVNTSIVKEQNYWGGGARDLVVILDDLKERGIFDWEKKENRIQLSKMSRMGDISPLLKLYADANGIKLSALQEHFNLVRDGFFDSLETDIRASIQMVKFTLKGRMLGLHRVVEKQPPAPSGLPQLPTLPAVAGGAVSAGQADAAILCYQRGVDFAKSGKYDEAILEYLKAIELKPDYILAYQEVGKIYMRLERFAEAIATYRRILELTPGDEKAQESLIAAYISYGNLCYNSDRYEEAIEAFNNHLKLKPDEISVLNLLGYAYIALGRYDEAIRVYQRVLELDPEEEIAIHRLVDSYLELAKTYTAAGNHAEAIKVYRRALEPNNALSPQGLIIFCLEIAEACKKAGYYAQAIKAYQNILALEPKDASGRIGLISCIKEALLKKCLTEELLPQLAPIRLDYQEGQYLLRGAEELIHTFRSPPSVAELFAITFIWLNKDKPQAEVIASLKDALTNLQTNQQDIYSAYLTHNLGIDVSIERLQAFIAGLGVSFLKPAEAMPAKGLLSLLSNEQRASIRQRLNRDTQLELEKMGKLEEMPLEQVITTFEREDTPLGTMFRVSGITTIEQLRKKFAIEICFLRIRGTGEWVAIKGELHRFPLDDRLLYPFDIYIHNHSKSHQALPSPYDLGFNFSSNVGNTTLALLTGDDGITDFDTLALNNPETFLDPLYLYNLFNVADHVQWPAGKTELDVNDPQDRALYETYLQKIGVQYHFTQWEAIQGIDLSTRQFDLPELLESSDPRIRLSAIHFFRRLTVHYPDLVNVLGAYSRDPDERVQHIVLTMIHDWVSNLGEMGLQRQNAMQAFLNSPYESIRTKAQQFLESTAPAEAVPAKATPAEAAAAKVVYKGTFLGLVRMAFKQKGKLGSRYQNNVSAQQEMAEYWVQLRARTLGRMISEEEAAPLVLHEILEILDEDERYRTGALDPILLKFKAEPLLGERFDELWDEKRGLAGHTLIKIAGFIDLNLLTLESKVFLANRLGLVSPDTSWMDEEWAVAIKNAQEKPVVIQDSTRLVQLGPKEGVIITNSNPIYLHYVTGKVQLELEERSYIIFGRDTGYYVPRGTEFKLRNSEDETVFVLLEEVTSTEQTAPAEARVAITKVAPVAEGVTQTEAAPVEARVAVTEVAPVTETLEAKFARLLKLIEKYGPTGPTPEDPTFMITPFELQNLIGLLEFGPEGEAKIELDYGVRRAQRARLMLSKTASSQSQGETIRTAQHILQKEFSERQVDQRLMKLVEEVEKRVVFVDRDVFEEMGGGITDGVMIYGAIFFPQDVEGDELLVKIIHEVLHIV